MTLQPLVSPPTFEHRRDGLGIGTPTPRISWTFSYPPNSNELGRNWTQRAHEIEIKRSWSSATAIAFNETSQSVLVPWPFDPLESGASAEIRVRCYGQGKEDITDWSPWEMVESGLFENQDWVAVPISSATKFQEDGLPLRPLRFRKQFTLSFENDEIKRARLYVTAHGVYEVHLNGSRVGNHVLAPGWTSYHHRLLYQTFDVIDKLLSGENTLTVEVAEGWFAGKLGIRGGKPFNYGCEVAVLAQLEIITMNDKVVVKSDSTWKCSSSAIISSGIYNGEVYDCNLEHRGWQSTMFNDSQWAEVKEVPWPASKLLVASDAPPVRVTQEIRPVAIITSASDKTILDFGQNLVGVVRINKVPAQSSITLTHAEVLDNGELGMRPLRGAKCRDVVITSDYEILNWSPKFTYHGFRFVQIDGWPAGQQVALDNFTGLVIHTDMRRRGWFECSNNMINKLHENIVWSMRGNFVSLPTDCPQRDERLGWTGDIQIFSPTSNFLYDCTGILSNWLDDVSVEQLARHDKIPGLVVPNVMEDFWTPTPQAVWHDAVVLVPWSLYQSTGDPSLLSKHYSGMKAWLSQAIQRNPDKLWSADIWQLGDWVDPAAPANEPGNSRTDGTLVADAYLVYVTSIMSSISEILGFQEERKRYASDFLALKKAFHAKYVTPLGNLASFTQTAYSLAIQFGIIDDIDQLAGAGNSLARLVHLAKFHVSTGFVGTPLILPALTTAGFSSLAYRMLLEKHCPSWIYPITAGATTIWERWDALLPDGKLNPGQMLSFNHYAFGAVGAWLHRTVGGINSINGWKTIQVRPVPGGGLDYCAVHFEGPYGLVECRWEITRDIFKLRLSIPPNTMAEIQLPPQVIEVETPRFSIGSGSYSFDYKYKALDWPPRVIPGGPPAVISGQQCDCP